MLGFVGFFTPYFGRFALNKRNQPPLRRFTVKSPWKIPLKQVQSRIQKRQTVEDLNFTYSVASDGRIRHSSKCNSPVVPYTSNVMLNSITYYLFMSIYFNSTKIHEFSFKKKNSNVSSYSDTLLDYVLEISHNPRQQDLLKNVKGRTSKSQILFFIEYHL